MINELKGLGYSVAREAQPEIEKIFFQDTVEKFVPVYSLHE